MTSSSPMRRRPPGEWKARGAGLTIRYGYHPSPFGTALVMVTDRGLAGLAFADGGGEHESFEDMAHRWPNATYVEDSAATARYAARIFDPERWCAGEPLRIFLIGTDFQIRVWQALLKIPLGRATTYSTIAGEIGQPTASRAVGAAVGRNPISFVVPCHRALGKSGDLTGYHWGLTRKRAILGWEAGKAELGRREPCGVPPPTPPCVRFRTRRFMSRSIHRPPTPAALQAPSLVSRVPPATSGLGPLARHLLKAVGKAVRPPSTCSALHRLVRLLRLLLTSAAPSRRLATPLAHLFPEAGRQTSQGKTRDLRAIYLSHLRPHPPGDIGLRVRRPPRAGMRTPHMRFLFVRPALCLQLPSDLASRRRPGRSASGSHHQGPQRTFTSKSSAGYHPGQTVLTHHAPCLAHIG